MKKMKIMTLALCVLTIFGCQTKQGTGALIGTGGGAVLRCCAHCLKPCAAGGYGGGVSGRDDGAADRHSGSAGVAAGGGALCAAGLTGGIIL